MIYSIPGDYEPSITLNNKCLSHNNVSENLRISSLLIFVALITKEMI